MDIERHPDLERAVAGLLAEVAPDLPGHPGGKDSLAGLGLDSLAVAELAIAVEERFGTRLSEGDLTALRTVADVARVVGAGGAPGRRIPRALGLVQRPIRSFPGREIRWFFRMEVTGQEHVPASGPAILAANHRSMWDVPFHVIASPRPIQFMAKQELFRPPFPDVWWHALGGFAVRRDIADLRAVDVALGVLERGEVLGIYPEGTRSRTGQMLPFLRGAAWFALRTGAVLVPSGITGAARRGPWGTRPRRRTVRVRFGPPLPAEQEDDPVMRRKKAEALTDDLFEAISSLAAE